jgi:hypothetical protein
MSGLSRLRNGPLRDAILAFGPIEARPHDYGATAFYHRGRQLGHVHRNGSADVLLERATRDRVIADGLARPHPYEPDSGWVTSSAGDDEVILALFSIALNERQ